MIHCEPGHLLCAGGAQCVATSHVCDGDRGQLFKKEQKSSFKFIELAGSSFFGRSFSLNFG